MTVLNLPLSYTTKNKCDNLISLPNTFPWINIRVAFGTRFMVEIKIDIL